MVKIYTKNDEVYIQFQYGNEEYLIKSDKTLKEIQNILDDLYEKTGIYKNIEHLN